MNMPATSGVKLKQLTGLRYFAALLVFIFHLNWSSASDAFVKITGSGYVGVSFFFLLSGFVLSYSYGEKISGKKLGFVKYVLLRLARLSPLHIATAVPFILFAIYKSDFQMFKTLINLLYLQSWVPDSTYYFSLNAPSWSLSNEMFFYVSFFPLIFMTPKMLFKFCIALLSIIFFAAIFVESQMQDKVLFGNNTFAHWLFSIFPGFRLLEFVVGMLLYKAWKAKYTIAQWLILPSYILLFIAMYFAEDVPEAFRGSLYFLPFITVFFYSHLTTNGVFYRFYSSRLMVLLGEASFAFYLIHQPLIIIVDKMALKYNLTSASFSILSLILITSLSVLIYILYEQKVEIYLKGLVTRKLG